MRNDEVGVLRRSDVIKMLRQMYKGFCANQSGLPTKELRRLEVAIDYIEVDGFPPMLAEPERVDGSDDDNTKDTSDQTQGWFDVIRRKGEQDA